MNRKFRLLYWFSFTLGSPFFPFFVLLWGYLIIIKSRWSWNFDKTVPNDWLFFYQLKCYKKLKRRIFRSCMNSETYEFLILLKYFKILIFPSKNTENWDTKKTFDCLCCIKKFLFRTCTKTLTIWVYTTIIKKATTQKLCLTK